MLFLSLVLALLYGFDDYGGVLDNVLGEVNLVHLAHIYRSQKLVLMQRILVALNFKDLCVERLAIS